MEPLQVQISPIIQPYISETVADAAPQKLARYRDRFEKLLSPRETQIATLQSLLIWEKPARSLLLFCLVTSIFW